MPVRFRCMYCNQLLGISRRKTGTFVKCPTCQGQVLVPSADTEDAVKKAKPDKTLSQEQLRQAKQGLLEHSDFDLVLNVPGSGQAPVHAEPPAKVGQKEMAAPVSAPPQYLEIDVERLPDIAPQQTTGITLTPVWLTVLSVGVIVGLALMFGLGLIVGKNMGKQKGEAKDNTEEVDR